MKREIRVGLVLIMALVLMLVPLTASCAPKPSAEEPEPGTEIVTLKIASTGPATGPWAAVAGQWDAAFKDYIGYVNENELVPGVEFELFTGDTGYNPAQSLSLYERFKEEGIILFHTITTTDAEPLTEFLNQDELVGICTSVSPKMVDPSGYWFTTACLYPDLFAGLCAQIEEQWDYDANGREPRIANIGFDNPLGKGPSEAKDYVAENYDVDFSLDITVPFGVTDVTSELTRVKEAEIDYLYLTVGVPETILILKTMAGMEMKETTSAIMGATAGGFYSIQKQMPDLFGDLSLVTFYAHIDEDLPGCNLARQLQKANRPDDPYFEDTPYFMGFMPAMLGVEAIRMAVEEVGAANLTSADIKTALESGVEFDFGGVIPNTAFGPDTRLIPYAFYFTLDETGTVKTSEVMPLPNTQGIK